MAKAGETKFGTKLRTLREKAGLTQVELAKRAGLHSQGVVKLERGEREPAWATVQVLADALGVDCTAFTNGSDGAAKKPGSRQRKGK